MDIFCFWKKESPNYESHLPDLEKRSLNLEKVHFPILEMLVFPDLESSFPNLEKNMWPETADCIERQSSSTSIGIVRNLSTRCHYSWLPNKILIL